MNDLMQYFARIFGAMLLIRAAASLVKDAEKLITANVKARLPDVAEVIDGAERTEWPDPLDTPELSTEAPTEDSLPEYAPPYARVFTETETSDATED